MSSAEKVRENKVRRIAKRRGMFLSKSRVRDRLAIGYGEWTLATVTGASAVYRDLAAVEAALLWQA